MQAPRVAARVESWSIGENEETAESVVGNGDDDEFEELTRVTVGRAPTERQRRQHEEGNHSVYREFCDGGSKLIKHREDQEYSQICTS